MTELRFAQMTKSNLKNIFTIIFCLVYSLSFSQLDTEWSIVYGGSNSEVANAVTTSSDGGCIVAGYTFSNNNDVMVSKGNADIWIAKLSASGSREWVRTYGGSGFDVATDIQQSPDGGYVILGHTNSTDDDIDANCNAQDIVVIKINSIGTIQWTEIIGGTGDDFGEGLLVHDDGSIALCGYGFSNFNNTSILGSSNAWLVNMSANGDIVWTRTFGGSGTDIFYDLKATNDGGYIMTGTTLSDDNDITNNDGLFDGWIVKTSSTGSLQWSKTYGGSQQDYLKAITLDDGNAYVCTGWTNSNDGDLTQNKGSKDYWMIKLSNSGNKIWSKTFGGSYQDEAKNIILDDDGGFIISGTSNSKDGDKPSNKGTYDAWIIKTNSNGNINWTEVYGGSKNESINDISKTTNGGFFFAGYSASSNGDINQNKGKEDFWACRLGDGTIPTVNLGGNITICPNEEVELDASASCSGCNFLWSNGSTDGIITVSPSVSTTYSVTVTNTSGNTSGSIMVNVNPIINVNGNASNATCDEATDGSILLSVGGGAGGFNYNWSNGASAQNLFNIGAGMYTVTVTDANLCTTTESFTITEPMGFQVSESIQMITCFGDVDGSISLNVTGSAGNANYLWSNGSTSSNIDNLSAGTYQVTISDNSACSKVESYQIVEPNSLQVNSLVDLVTCTGEESGAVDITVTGGLEPYTFSWNNGVTTEDISGVGGGVYSVVISDANGCQAVKTFTIGEPVALGAFINANPPTNGNNGNISLNPFGGISPYTITWSTGQTGQSITGLANGTYTVTITDNLGCTYEETIMLGVTAINDLQPDVLELFPNPTDDRIHLRMEGGEHPLSDVAIYNINGKLMKNHFDKDLIKGMELRFHPYPKGIYLLKITNQDAQLVRKIIVQ